MDVVKHSKPISDSKSKCDCVILCGGKGIRISRSSEDMPKALLKVDNKELIRYTIDLLNPSFVDKLIFAVDYQASRLREFVESLSLKYPVTFSYREAPDYLYGVRAAARESDKRTILFCHADDIKLGFDLSNALKFHTDSGNFATAVTTYTNNLYKHWIVESDKNDNVLELKIPPNYEYQQNKDQTGVVLAGALILDKEAVEYSDPKIGTDYMGVVKPLIDARKLKLFISKTKVLFNINTHEDLIGARTYFNELRRK